MAASNYYMVVVVRATRFAAASSIVLELAPAPVLLPRPHRHRLDSTLREDPFCVLTRFGVNAMYRVGCNKAVLSVHD
jgi:hypothetical protein